MTIPDHVGVFGGGRMGTGIAHAFLVAGASVTVIEADAGAAEAAELRIIASLEKAEQLHTLPAPMQVVKQRLTVDADPDALHGCGLIVEAVPEVTELKAAVLALIEGVAPHAVLATNTSSLSVDELATPLRQPTKFLGLHFFNPVPASQLVEIVVGTKTADDVVATAHTWIKSLDKTAITVKDAPGFASSRLGVAIALEAMRMVEDDVASVADIDAAMTLGYKHPMGPLRTTDIVGLDVRLAIAEHLAHELGPRFEPPAILRDKVAAGELGRKAGQGFYSW
ncbi:3-hydroxyacyl-CoA dehydrogenase family protein [Mycolicibacterium smegmatis]|uniref:3-hydroxyacyl-CoA dehydrogenase n=3 Tax=Mycobacteriaceae TaxID=1762 RepID=I7GCW0_MYCS2|nr:3-hydroxyacyl-CoA dehydrogenase family protein [Mycolicibacterium smegmatis]VTP02503.1 3-hydroxybutyryl-CoA dehydrogenase [Mycobacterium riyadhense]ABK75159.1 3-hydroxyacyl-CoA dehydrogenase [Mycolicibacterium smegmatis MC2 155]AFP40469.1 3-hydroxyacyl-CoA dehydrogenase [Mycolicibacterium smegmatis MC2 155]AIU09211.1 3-hydroxybutyryl-CoA dehydrogenase [Mycolicibacterium smegmatis MC2 155]AIU15836.1 3-hydroxybutyryl-CoA dehydrogenase [Mycolicibacterium smegmatis]